MSNTTGWRDQVLDNHADKERCEKFIERIEHYIKNYKAARKKGTSKDPLISLKLFKRLEDDANRLKKTMNRVKPEQRMILSRGQSHETAEEYVAFFEQMTEIERNLDEWIAQLVPIREALNQQPLKGQVIKTKYDDRNAFIGVTCMTYEAIFSEPAVFENKTFNKFLRLLTNELGIPNEKMRRLYKAAYPPELRDINPLEIVQF